MEHLNNEDKYGYKLAMAVSNLEVLETEYKEYRDALEHPIEGNLAEVHQSVGEATVKAWQYQQQSERIKREIQRYTPVSAGVASFLDKPKPVISKFDVDKGLVAKDTSLNPWGGKSLK